MVRLWTLVPKYVLPLVSNYLFFLKNSLFVVCFFPSNENLILSVPEMNINIFWTNTRIVQVGLHFEKMSFNMPVFLF